METSALESTNVDTAFTRIITEIYQLLNRKSIVGEDELKSHKMEESYNGKEKVSGNTAGKSLKLTSAKPGDGHGS